MSPARTTKASQVKTRIAQEKILLTDGIVTLSFRDEEAQFDVMELQLLIERCGQEVRQQNPLDEEVNVTEWYSKIKQKLQDEHGFFVTPSAVHSLVQQVGEAYERFFPTTSD